MTKQYLDKSGLTYFYSKMKDKLPAYQDYSTTQFFDTMSTGVYKVTASNLTLRYTTTYDSGGSKLYDDITVNKGDIIIIQRKGNPSSSSDDPKMYVGDFFSIQGHTNVSYKITSITDESSSYTYNWKANDSVIAKTSELVNDSGYQTASDVSSAISGKQDTLVSGTNIKTINNTNLLGSGNVDTYQTITTDCSVFDLPTGTYRIDADGAAVYIPIDSDFDFTEAIDPTSQDSNHTYIKVSGTYGWITIEHSHTDNRDRKYYHMLLVLDDPEYAYTEKYDSNSGQKVADTYFTSASIMYFPDHRIYFPTSNVIKMSTPTEITELISSVGIYHFNTVGFIRNMFKGFININDADITMNCLMDGGSASSYTFPKGSLFCFNKSIQAGGIAGLLICSDGRMYKITGSTNLELIGTTIGTVGDGCDTLPIGAIIDYDGDTVPDGYVEVGGEVIVGNEVDDDYKVNVIKSKNLFDYSTLKNGIILNNSGVETSHSDWATSPYIEVKSLTEYTYSYATTNPQSIMGLLTEYDSSYTFIRQTIINADTQTLTMSLTTKYVRLCKRLDINMTNIQFELGTATTYSQFVQNQIYVNGTKFTDTLNVSSVVDSRSRVNFLKGEQLYNSENVEIGKTWQGNDNSNRSRLVLPITPNEVYNIKVNGENVVVNIIETSDSPTSSSSPIYTTDVSLNTQRTFKASSTTQYITIQFSASTTMTTEIMSALQISIFYGTPSIVVDNEEIYNSNVMNYSTSEQRIGTWIDGKPLYRKVYSITSPSSSNTNYEDLTSLNIDRLVHLYGYYKNDSGTFGIPFHDSDANYSVMFLSSTNKLRGRISNPSDIVDTKVIIEYTKTTD